MLPAYAGMIPTIRAFLNARLGAPRVCGDDDPSSGMSLQQMLGAPRVCGDDPKFRYSNGAGRLCSPRMRG